ncbi:MAG TPA: hypothetical protein VK978_04810 [Candidatus Saccharimonadales bacterium]|nr:hypothetical protein [Candidatus Saccharimonadales bacterium]
MILWGFRIWWRAEQGNTEDTSPRGSFKALLAWIPIYVILALLWWPVTFGGETSDPFLLPPWAYPTWWLPLPGFLFLGILVIGIVFAFFKRRLPVIIIGFLLWAWATLCGVDWFDLFTGYDDDRQQELTITNCQVNGSKVTGCKASEAGLWTISTTNTDESVVVEPGTDIVYTSGGAFKVLPEWTAPSPGEYLINVHIPGDEERSDNFVVKVEQPAAATSSSTPSSALIDTQAVDNQIQEEAPEYTDEEIVVTMEPDLDQVEERGTTWFSEETIESPEDIATFLADEGERNAAARDHVVTCLRNKEYGQDEIDRALSGAGYVAMQLKVDSQILGNTYFEDGQAFEGNEWRSVEEGDFFWLFVDQDGNIVWCATLRADCANPDLHDFRPAENAPPAPTAGTPKGETNNEEVTTTEPTTSAPQSSTAPTTEVPRPSTVVTAPPTSNTPIPSAPPVTSSSPSSVTTPGDKSAPPRTPSAPHPADRPNGPAPAPRPTPSPTPLQEPVDGPVTEVEGPVPATPSGNDVPGAGSGCSDISGNDC